MSEITLEYVRDLAKEAIDSVKNGMNNSPKAEEYLKLLWEELCEVDLAKNESVSNNKPVMVCLCGSTRFKDAFIKAARDETLQAKIVLSVGLFGHEEGMDMDGPTKKMLDELHLRKIDLADEVLFLNVGGYIGQSTQRELAYARAHGKKVRFLEECHDA